MSAQRRLAQHYNRDALAFGDSVEAVNWSSRENQALRFAQFLPFLPSQEPFSLNDVGCGLADFLPFLQQARHQAFRYTGYDLSPAMIDLARQKYGATAGVTFQTLTFLADLGTADYSIASGTFNRRQRLPGKRSYLRLMYTTLEAMARTSRVGFGFNFLSDKQKPHRYNGLLYLNPEQVIRHGKKAFGMKYEVLNSYHTTDITLWWYR
ncbi:MAG: class I SAM-dependent methyltransferase [Bacteroidota bacterium]